MLSPFPNIINQRPAKIKQRPVVPITTFMYDNEMAIRNCHAYLSPVVYSEPLKGIITLHKQLYQPIFQEHQEIFTKFTPPPNLTSFVLKFNSDRFQSFRNFFTFKPMPTVVNVCVLFSDKFLQVRKSMMKLCFKLFPNAEHLTIRIPQINELRIQEFTDMFDLIPSLKCIDLYIRWSGESGRTLADPIFSRMIHYMPVTVKLLPIIPPAADNLADSYQIID